MGMGPQLMVTPMVGDKDSTLPSFSSLPGTLEYWRPQLEQWIDRSNAWSRDVCFFSQIWRHVFCCFFCLHFLVCFLKKHLFFGRHFLEKNMRFLHSWKKLSMISHLVHEIYGQVMILSLKFWKHIATWLIDLGCFQTRMLPGPRFKNVTLQMSCHELCLKSHNALCIHCAVLCSVKIIYCV